jgi:hypothetical protein
MTLTTTQLDDAVGVQYAGVRDLSEASTAPRLTVGVLVGKFKRGKFYQPFEVTLQNLRARLGYQPNNLDYMAVQDALDAGMPSLWVMRVPDASGIGLDCAPTTLSFPPTTIPNAEFRIYYSVDDGPVEFWEYNLEVFDMDYLFERFFETLDFVVGGGGGLGHFQFISQFTPSQISGAGASSVEELNPRTLTLHLAPPENTAVDVIELVFGTSVSVHSCAVVNFLGI